MVHQQCCQDTHHISKRLVSYNIYLAPSRLCETLWDVEISLKVTWCEYFVRYGPKMFWFDCGTVHPHMYPNVLALYCVLSWSITLIFYSTPLPSWNRCYMNFLYNTLKLRQNGRHFYRRHFDMYIFLNENLWIYNKISLRYVPSSLIDNKYPFVQIIDMNHVCSFGTSCILFVHLGAVSKPNVISQNLVKSRSRMICIQNNSIALKFDTRLGGTAAEAPVNFHSE